MAATGLDRIVQIDGARAAFARVDAAQVHLLLIDAPATVRPIAADAPGTSSRQGRAAIVTDDARHVDVTVDAPSDGFLLLADTFYPGWRARVDGREAPIYRANISVRAVAVSAGRHDVTFVYEPPGLVRGLTISLAAFATLLAWAGAAAYTARRDRR